MTMSDATTAAARDPYDYDDLVPIEVPVSYKGRKYVLREASGDAAARYRNAMLKATKLVDGKVSSLDGMADLEPLLVSLCLWEKTPTGEGAVSTGFVRSFPARMLKQLFEKTKSISDLDENDPQSPLIKPLALPTSPVTIEQLREFAATLGDDEEYAAFKKLVEPPKEERAKN